jgi:hypothetical protein
MRSAILRFQRKMIMIIISDTLKRTACHTICRAADAHATSTTVEIQISANIEYRALQWGDDYEFNLGDLIRQLPELVLGRHVAIAWSDSGSYYLSAHEIADGWHRVGDFAISPLITDIAQLPTPGFDEWYIFEHLPDCATLSRFSTAIAFAPFADFGMADPFWSQVQELQPMHALHGGVDLLLITQDAAMLESVAALYPIEDR